VEEAQGAVQGAVLIVDAGVDVSDVGLVDEFRGSLVVVSGPGEEFDVIGETEGRSGLVRREVVLHEESGVHGEAGGQEGLVDGAGVVEEKLRFDSLNAGGVLQELEQLVEKRLRDLNHLRGVAGYGEGVADDSLLTFIDAKGKAADASAIERDKAGQDAGVEILEEEFGGALVVPAEALFPEA